MNIYFDDTGEEKIPDALYGKLIRLTKKCLDRHNKPIDMEISCSFVTGDEIRQLNNDYRQIDALTDVLSFPVPASFTNNNALGDIVICTASAKKQAETYGHSFEREITFLFVHGLLHLLGYYHGDETEDKIMREEQRAVLNEDEK
jgi:probable rRNA maturation factor